MKGVILVTLVGVLALLAAPWALARIARRYGTDDVKIAPPVPHFEGMDDSLRLRSEARRKHAESIRVHAARVESGDRAVERIRLVR